MSTPILLILYMLDRARCDVTGLPTCITACTLGHAAAESGQVDEHIELDGRTDGRADLESMGSAPGPGRRRTDQPATPGGGRRRTRRSAWRGGETARSRSACVPMRCEGEAAHIFSDAYTDRLRLRARPRAGGPWCGCARSTDPRTDAGECTSAATGRGPRRRPNSTARDRLRRSRSQSRHHGDSQSAGRCKSTSSRQPPAGRPGGAKSATAGGDVTWVAEGAVACVGSASSWLCQRSKTRCCSTRPAGGSRAGDQPARASAGG